MRLFLFLTPSLLNYVSVRVWRNKKIIIIKINFKKILLGCQISDIGVHSCVVLTEVYICLQKKKIWNVLSSVLLNCLTQEVHTLVDLNIEEGRERGNTVINKWL